jgi:hypothetical protein
MKKNWNKQKDKFNKKLNNIFFVRLKQQSTLYVVLMIYHQELHRQTARKCHSDGNPTWMGTTPG